MVTIPANRHEVIGSILAYHLLARRLCDELRARGVTKEELSAMGDSFILELHNQDFQGFSYAAEHAVAKAAIDEMIKFFRTDDGPVATME